jgi:hypothetical protein
MELNYYFDTTTLAQENLDEVVLDAALDKAFHAGRFFEGLSGHRSVSVTSFMAVLRNGEVITSADDAGEASVQISAVRPENRVLLTVPPKHLSARAATLKCREAQISQFLRRCAVPVPLGLTLEVQREPRSVFVNCLTSQPDSSGSTNPASPQQPERFVDANALAEHLSVTRRQILEMTRRGVIPGHPLGIGTSRRVWRYKISEVEAALAAGVRKAEVPHKADALADHSARRTIPVGSPRSQKGKL